MYQISTDATHDHFVRTLELLAANLAAAGRDAELDIRLDEGVCQNGAGEDISDEYENAADEAEKLIAEETQSDAPIGTDGSRAGTWMGRDGWYWTIISPDSIQYDDDHGPYESRDDALEAIAEVDVTEESYAQ